MMIRATKLQAKRFLPGYFSSLKDQGGKKRYLEKISIIGGFDPYQSEKSEWQDDVDLWPGVTCVHIGMYLLVNPSPYSGEDLVNYKSLDCYMNFLSGWVREILVKASDNDKRVVIAKVNHSQRLSEKPLTPWIIAEANGKILSAHCDCMAGLGECCSHVASVLWAIECGVRIRDSMTVTQKKAYWVIPNAVKEVPYAPVKNIDFVGKKRSFNEVVQSSSSGYAARPSPSPSSTSSYPPLSSSSLFPLPSPSTSSSISSSSSKSPASALKPPTNEETNSFFTSLASCKTKPAILSLIEPYSSAYIPKSLDEDLPMCLTELYKSEYLQSSYGELLKLAQGYTIVVTPAEAKAVEAKTRSQSRSSLWFRMRSGRITASHFKSASCTSPASPSISLVNSICHPEVNKFKSAATNWGCQHEKIALADYSSASVHKHHNFKVEDCGLFIDTDNPFIGASPDSLVSCSCCGDGICEIKCPYCHKQDSIADAAEDAHFCLVKHGDTFELKHNHTYYYQIQCQLFCSKRSYCDFVIWTEDDIHIERIYPDDGFWLENVAKVKQIFTTAILPELMGKFYSRPNPPLISASQSGTCNSMTVTTLTSSPVSQKNTYCYCHGPDEGEMVGCDNSNCVYEWFHMECLGLALKPKSKYWYCPDCRKLPEFQRKKRKVSL